MCSFSLSSSQCRQPELWKEGRQYSLNVAPEESRSERATLLGPDVHLMMIVLSSSSSKSAHGEDDIDSALARHESALRFEPSQLHVRKVPPAHGSASLKEDGAGFKLPYEVWEWVRTGCPLKGVACRLGSSVIKAASAKRKMRSGPACHWQCEGGDLPLTPSGGLYDSDRLTSGVADVVESPV